MAITLPLLMLLYDLRFRKRRTAGEYLKYYLSFFLVAAFYLLARWAVVGGIVQGEKYWGSNAFESLMTVLKAVAGYIRLSVLPLNLRADYVIEIPRSLFEADMAMALLALAAAFAAYLRFRRNRAVSFFILWFFATLIPVSNIVPFKAVMAERFLYLPLIGFSGLLGLLIARAYRAAPKTIAVSAACLMIFYGAGTISRNIDWRDEISLFTKDLAKSPEGARFHYNLAYAYCRKYVFGDFKREGLEGLMPYYLLAERELKETIRLKPDHADSYINLSTIYLELEQYDKAMDCLKRLLSFEEAPRAYNNMGILYYEKGR